MSNLTGFIDAVSEATAKKAWPVRLQLTPAQLALWLSHWQPAQPAIVVADVAADGWLPLAEELTEHERGGLVTTQLTTALHQLLTDSPTTRLIVPLKAAALAVPSKTAYQEHMMHLTLHQRLSLSRDLTARLVERGWKRHRSVLEPGTFRLRGEQLDLQHPALPGTYTITLYSDAIESLVYHDGQRHRTMPRLSIPPMTFPQGTAPLRSLISDWLIIRPMRVTSIAATKEIIYDSATPLLPFPYIPEDPVSRSTADIFLGELTVGRPAVHADHGVGIYEGLHLRTLAQVTREYLVLRYAAGDSISVPVEYAHKVTPYIGQKNPPLHRLGGTLWLTTRRKAQHDAAAFAKELLTVARGRQSVRRSPYYLDPTLEKELEQTFPYEFTPDQARSWQEIKKDLQQSVPMDRLVIGDVGFGKTELAQRATAHVAGSGRQVAVIAPTTLLAQQHTDTFQARFAHLSLNVAQLSRFVAAKQRAITLQGIAAGRIQIVIGTHALLSKRLTWNNLGLVIIDEEQRFGVKHKEHFKQLRSTVDVLSLSATPIPRTLSMAMAGLKGLSVIMTPPAGRQDVATFIKHDQDDVLAAALTQELNRSGQCYIVLPRIRGLGSVARRITRLLPHVRVGVAHGQLPERELATIIHQFDSGQLDVLVSSTIVENGLDLPNVNTMIIFNAPSYGLSDLYQLRGRIGRRQRQGYCYLLYNQHELTPLQRERLTAITEASRLGAGWEIARRDLEIRGAGNLLGAEQSGSVVSVGLQLYLDMIRTATIPTKTIVPEKSEIDIALSFPALLPPTYITDLTERTLWYTRLSRAHSFETLARYITELTSAFGPLPEEAHNLLTLLKLQLAAAKAGIIKMSSKTITPPDDPPFERLAIEAQNIPTLIKKLSSFGKLTVRDTTLYVDVPEITPVILQSMVDFLRF